MAFHEVEGEMTADKTSPASIPPARKKKLPQKFTIYPSLFTHRSFVIVFPV